MGSGDSLELGYSTERRRRTWGRCGGLRRFWGADFIFTIGRRYRHQCSDTMKAPRHIPLYNYADYDDFFRHLPWNCPVIAVELADNSVPLKGFVHPERCVYLLGAEDHGLPESVLCRCRETVQLIGDYCMNVATAGSIVMYDRAVKMGTGR